MFSALHALYHPYARGFCTLPSQIIFVVVVQIQDLINDGCHLPAGHFCKLHDSWWLALPWQGFPPCAGAGLLHILDLVLTPWLHVLLQDPQFDHLLHCPSTGSLTRKIISRKTKRVNLFYFKFRSDWLITEVFFYLHRTIGTCTVFGKKHFKYVKLVCLWFSK